MMTRKRGPKPDLRLDKKVFELREGSKKLTFRAIGKILGIDVKNVFLRYQRAKEMLAVKKQ